MAIKGIVVPFDLSLFSNTLTLTPPPNNALLANLDMYSYSYPEINAGKVSLYIMLKQLRHHTSALSLEYTEVLHYM